MPLHLPSSTLVSTPFSLRASALPHNQTVTVQAETHDRHGEVWKSEATFQTETQGNLDLGRQAPLSGFYSGLDGHGLLWSLRPRESLSPAFFESPADGHEVRVVISADGHTLAQSSTRRLLRAPGLQDTPIREGGLHGTLFTPPPELPLRGAALVLGGSEGGLYPGVAALLASEGFLTLGLAYFGVAGLPASLINIPLDYFQVALAFLRAHPLVAGRRVGVLGASKGAEAALLLGATFPGDVGAVAAIAPGGVVFEGIDRVGTHPLDQPLSSWSLEGRPLPYLPYRADWGALFAGPSPVSLTPAHREALHQASPETLAAATIPVERIEGHVLLVSGGDDAMWNAHELGVIAQRRREAAGLPVEHLYGPQAGHALGLPGLPTLIRTTWTAMGGSDAANAHLQFRAWARTLAVLDTVWEGD